jgi:hypothetical protein
MRMRIGTDSAQNRHDSGDIVAPGWRVEPLPSRVGTRARVPREGREEDCVR